MSSALAQEYVPGEVIVKLKGKASSQASAQFLGKMKESSKLALKGSLSAFNMHKFALKGQADVNQTVAELQADPDVEYAEPNYILKKIGEEDTQSFSLSEVPAALEAKAASLGLGVGAMSSSGFSQNYAPVKVDEAWGVLSNNSDRPIVAIIDSGVDYSHDVFTQTDAIWTNSGEVAGNGLDDDGNGYIDDVRGWNFYAKTNDPMDDDDHGTHVAGIVLGVSQDILGSSLSQAKIRIMPLKFLNASGSGSTSDAISAIYYAVNNGAQVINNSWGGASYSRALLDALAYAYNHRVLVVAAAGNAGSNNDSNPMYPANYSVPSQISVASTSDFDVLSSFSNYGSSTVHVAAPGDGILSTVPGDTFRFMRGTSMAAPFVAGLGALMVREASQLTGYQIKNLILSSVDRLNGLSGKATTAGRVNVERALLASQGEVSTQASQPDYVASYQSERAPASEEKGKGGCGTVAELAALRGKGGDGLGPWGPVMALSLLPLLVWFMLRQAGHGKNRRRYERFQMASDIKIKAGDKELVGHMKTISVGGLSFSAEEMLEKGGVVTMNISSPDGAEQIQVQGHIVWSEANKAYGVAFDETRSQIRDAIAQWTTKLVKSN